jgi:hypothetical protein
MKFRKHAVDNPQPDATREDVRSLAEALSLYRSAMHHVAEREVARHPFVPGLAETRPAHPFRMRLLLAPALAAGVAAAVLVPLYGRHHQPPAVRVAANVAAGPTVARADVDDTALMNQIDSELSEDVPDALRPLADLSDQTTTNPVSEKKNVTNE